jgi:FtsZ-binding cell division protein ZapB
MPARRKIEVISFRDIAKFVEELQDRMRVPNYRNQIDSSVMLVLDRYWGDKSYKIENWEMYEKYLSEILSSKDCPEQIVYKGVESGFLGFAESQRLKVFKHVTDSKFSHWDHIVTTDSNFRYLTSPEALFLGGRISPGSFFSFDGSTALVAELSQFNVNVIWPDEIKPTGIFSEPWTENLILQKSQMYREVAEQFKIENGLSEISVKTLGTGIREFISRFILRHFEQERDVLTQERDVLTQERDALTQERDALTQERDALTQERDALTQERDALTQERDALTQERDALTQERDALTQERDALTQERDALVTSTIWKTTKSLRGIISWLRKYR